MAKNIIKLDELEVAVIKKHLKKKMMKATNQQVVNYSIQTALNAIKYFDTETLGLIEPSKKELDESEQN